MALEAQEDMVKRDAAHWQIPIVLFVPTEQLQSSAHEATGAKITHEEHVETSSASSSSFRNESIVQKRCREAHDQGYDTIAVHLAKETWRNRWERLCLLPEMDLPRSSSRATLSLALTSQTHQSNLRVEAERWRAHPTFFPDELNLTSAADARKSIVLLSPWIELDSVDEGVRWDAELAIKQELSYAVYLGATHVVLPPPSSDPSRRKHLANYARVVHTLLTGTQEDGFRVPSTLKLSIHLPVSSPYILSSMLMRQATKARARSQRMPAAAYLRTNDNWAWETWESIQTLCGYHPQLHVGLDLSVPLPPNTSLLRWTAEPVSLLWLPSGSFLANAKGYPVLSKSAQSLVRRLLPKHPTIILSEIHSAPSQHTKGGPRAYLEYIHHLIHTAPAPSKLQLYAQGYGDHLQAPLQPMANDLGATTYEVFESDPVKYQLYEQAIYQALVDRSEPHSMTQIWIVGAGHGALVPRALSAAKRASRFVHITALEKNPGACIALHDRQKKEWHSDSVSILQGDMRTIPVLPYKDQLADIIVSELLGSFADNELAPECLDGAMRFLKPNGISIPSAYAPFLAPVAAANLHAAIGHSSRSSQVQNGVGMGTDVTQQTYDAPYVTLLPSANLLAEDEPQTDSSSDEDRKLAVQPCWRFEHGPMSTSGLVCTSSGLPESNHHNVRASYHTFCIPHAGVCHGLAGFFEAHLYGDVVLSIHPDVHRASQDMVSWFPIFFPFRDPIYLPAHSELDVHIWRLSNERRVWYEWSAECFLVQEDMASPPAASSSSFLSSQSPQDMPTSAFSNAMHTPRLPSTSAFLAPLSSTSPATHDSITGQSDTSSFLSTSSNKARRTRIKTGQTARMNPGAIGSSSIMSG
ncbi:type II protein arginine methyltransferase [Malassezia psittaci]|uniref:Type II protein arginine methyltransferase n=1 Tax=Malassezia psittaci TaxID=1821823 RepID=A0AAF0FJ31_9BASI|nr:type II protein arginine methyltransferase [Malassezia psittaci]